MTVLHARTHPTLDVPGCFGCQVAGVSIAPSATPTRRPGAAHALRTNRKEKEWRKDMDAYRRLRKDGVQPRQIDGSATLEKHATDRRQIEGVFG